MHPPHLPSANANATTERWHVLCTADRMRPFVTENTHTICIDVHAFRARDSLHQCVEPHRPAILRVGGVVATFQQDDRRPTLRYSCLRLRLRGYDSTIAIGTHKTRYNNRTHSIRQRPFLVGWNIYYPNEIKLHTKNNKMYDRMNCTALILVVVIRVTPNC